MAIALPQAAPNARCIRCGTSYVDPSGATACPNCGEMIDIESIGAAAPKQAKAAAQGRPKQAATSSTHLANIVAMLLWCAAWGLNGLATVLPIALLGRSAGVLGIFIGIGIAAHIIISLIENHLWRSFRHCRPGEKLLIGLEIFAVGLIDVLSAALMFLFALLWLGIAAYTPPWYTVCVLIAMVVAIGSEPMIRFHRKLLRR